MSADPSRLMEDAAWPRQSWFLRGPLLTTVVLLLSVTALVVELVVMLVSGDHVFGYLGVGVAALGLLIFFRARWWALALVTAGAVVSALFASEHVGVWTVAVFTMFLFARRGRHVLWAVSVTAAAVYLSLVTRAGGGLDDPVALLALTLCVTAAAVGSAARLQNESWDAARQRVVDLAATQAVHLRQAVVDERLRIARDLHDVIGHELAVVNINIGVAEVTLRPEDARSALRSARQALNRTLQETQQILTLLRAGNIAADERSELALLENIPALVKRMPTAGSQIDAHIDAHLPEVDADVSAAAYRIVQEALTNANKHGTGPVQLRIASAGSALVIDVQNRRTRGSGTDGARRVGYGLIGMRERAESAGGTITVSESESTFGMHVELPTKASTS